MSGGFPRGWPSMSSAGELLEIPAAKHGELTVRWKSIPETNCGSASIQSVPNQGCPVPNWMSEYEAPKVPLPTGLAPFPQEIELFNVALLPLPRLARPGLFTAVQLSRTAEPPEQFKATAGPRLLLFVELSKFPPN